MLGINGEDIQILAKHTLTYLGNLRSRKVDLDGESFTYLEGGSGPVLLFLHGLGGSKTQWRTVMQQLSSRYRVVAVDIPGFSMQQLGHPDYRTLRDMVAWTQRFARAAEIRKFHIVAACSGAAVALSYALQMPDRVASLTLIGLPNLQQKEQLLQLLKELLVLTPEDVDRLMGQLFFRAPSLPSVIKRYYLNQILPLQPEIDIRLDEISRFLPQLLPRLRSLSCPVALISGDSDVFSPVSQLRSLGEFFDRKPMLAVIPQCGHLPYLEKPELLVKEIIRFNQEGGFQDVPASA